MRSFNRDRRVFCAILSTHSRATGVSLVEADAVVFYDSDLDPVMDAKAQEWCDRIGRRTDVHIYRCGRGGGRAGVPPSLTVRPAGDSSPCCFICSFTRDVGCLKLPVRWLVTCCPFNMCLCASFTGPES